MLERKKRRINNLTKTNNLKNALFQPLKLIYLSLIN